MANVETSKAYLCRVPFENDYKHSLHFNNKDEQLAYFQNTSGNHKFDVTYIRKDNKMRIEANFELLYNNFNYVAYFNPSGFGGKWYYAFIRDMRYISEDVTEIELETDVIQTWLFDYDLKPSFVEREHVSSDEPGEHTIPEGLETGDAIITGKVHDEDLCDLAIIMAYSDYASDNADVQGKVFNGVYSGLGYSAFPLHSEGVKSLNNMIATYDKAGKGDAINSIFMIPRILVTDDEDFGAMTLGSSYSAKVHNFEVDIQQNLDGYVPRNSKLLTFPYKYLMVNNNAGASAVYKEEKFLSGTKAKFIITGVVCPGGSIKLIPYDYNVNASGGNKHLNQSEGLIGGKYPVCCWNSDTYTNWLTQNTNMINATNTQHMVSATAGALSLMGGIALMATGVGAGMGAGMVAGGIGGISSGALGINSSMAQVKDMSVIPDQAKGDANCGDVITAYGDNTFMFYSMSIRNEYAKIIDSYFDMFGYKVNQVKVPNKAHRSRWWYTKTIDVNIDGELPSNEIQKIKNAYNNGITFWRNASEMGNYSLSNNIS